MSAPSLIIVGAGGHGRVLADALIAAGAGIAGFVDADPALKGRRVMGFEVLGGDAALEGLDRAEFSLVNGIGSLGTPDAPPTRRLAGERLAAAGWRIADVRHPSAIVAPSARLAAGVQLLARAVVQPAAEIGANVIVNTAAIVEHDCVVGAWSHVSIGAILCGGVRIGDGCHIGAGAVIIQGVRLGDSTIVGAGAAIVKDDDGPGPLVGVPARSRRSES